jgi:endonuclease YncB( thermonuclease family)/predicted flap endonuclease-1-like 5' DNA nuclease
LKRVFSIKPVVKPYLIALLLLQGAAAPVFANAPWVTLQGGHYLAKRPNDGDSFHVSVAGHEYIFRLYFIDAPETTAEFRDRVEEQAIYFGVTVDQVLQIGDLAKHFVKEKLSEPFLVRTCWEDAGGRSRLQRFYAFVQTRNGDLGEQLVENGLARIHAGTARPEGLHSAGAEWQTLVSLERRAKKEKVGGWGVEDGRMQVRAQQPESEKGIDPFDKFFHPAEMTQVDGSTTATPDSPATEDEEVAATATPSAKEMPEVKLNVNTASETELENIRGIGKVMAERIIAARPFKSADDLRNVKGIGEVKYAQIRHYFE